MGPMESKTIRLMMAAASHLWVAACYLAKDEDGGTLPTGPETFYVYPDRDWGWGEALMAGKRVKVVMTIEEDPGVALTSESLPKQGDDEAWAALADAARRVREIQKRRNT